MNILTELLKKDTSIRSIALAAMHEREALTQLLESVLSKKDVIRSTSFHVLLEIARYRPELLYAEWNYFTAMLSSPNTYHRSIAVHIIANILSVDKEARFEKLFDKFYGLLGDSVVVAGHLTTLSAKIVRSKPDLEPRITSKLLGIDRTDQKHKDLIKAGAIDAFSEYFEHAKDKKGIIEFVRAAADGESPKTRKKAKEFLKRFEV